MAFIKFKPLTPVFNFRKIITKDYPKYIYDYIEDEEIIYAYATSKDIALFTNKQIVLFNKRGFGKSVKEISAIPYHSILTSSVFFGPINSTIKLTLYNTYPLTLSFLNNIDKVIIKKTYILIETKIKNKFKEN